MNATDGETRVKIWAGVNATGAGVGVGVGGGAGVRVGVGVAVGVGDGLGVGVAIGTGVGTSVGVNLGSAVRMGVALVWEPHANVSTTTVTRIPNKINGFRTGPFTSATMPSGRFIPFTRGYFVPVRFTLAET